MSDRHRYGALGVVLGAWAAGLVLVLITASTAGTAPAVGLGVVLAGTAVAVQARAATRRRAVWAADEAVAGLAVAATGLGLCAAGGAVTGRLTAVVPVLAAVAALTGLVAVVGAVTVARDRQRAARAIPRALADAWRDADGGARFFAAGLLLAAPLTVVHNRVLADPDSARLLAIVRHVREAGAGYLVETQEVLLPHLLLAPAIALGGIGGGLAVSIAALMALCGLLTVLAWRLSGSLLGAFAAVPALWAAALTPNAVRLPMYPTALFLGYAGAWLAHRALQRDGAPVREALAALGLVAAIEAHAIAQLFLAVPVLLWATLHRRRAALPSLGRILGFTGLALVPRLAINLMQWDGSLRLLRSGRTDWFNRQGYLTEIAVELRGQPLDESAAAYLLGLGSAVVETFQPANWLLVGLAVVGLLLCRRRTKAFCAAAVVLFVAAILVARPGIFVRYLAPLLPGVALLAAVAIGLLARRSRIGLVASVIAVLALSAGAVTQFTRTVDVADRSVARVDALPVAEVVERIGAGASVIGVRSASLHYVTDDVVVYGGLFLTEDELVRYLAWPSDQAVLDLLEEHGIDWVLVHADRTYEVDYHATWVESAHGLEIRHLDRLRDSPAFCRVQRWPGGHELYRAAPCPVAVTADP